jgi:hypothetical protein
VNPNYGGAQSFDDLAPDQQSLEALFMFGRTVTASHFNYEA